MQLKTFRAPTMASALERARRELGPHALVLATNEIRGSLGLPSFEVTVAADEPVAPASRDMLRKIAREVDAARSYGADRAPSRPRPRPEAVESEAVDRDAIPAILQPAVEALVASGVSRDLAVRFGRCASGALPDSPRPEQVVTATETGLESLLVFRRAAARANVTFIAGPPGAGKTTTAAKLAARLAIASSRPVVLGVADHERIGALEQAEIYARYIGARVATVQSADDVLRALRDAGKGSSVIVDTPGIGSADERRMRELARLRRDLPDAAVALLIPCGLHRTVARGVIDRFEEIRPTVAGFSKVDDGARLGELVTALAPCRLPLSFITTGHRVPDDLEDATPRGIAARLLREGAAVTTASEVRA